MFGGVFGQAPMRLVVEATDWRTATLLLGAGGIALAILAWTTVRDKWRGGGGMANAASGFGRVAKHPQTWLIAIVGLGTSAPLLAFASLWSVPFLETAYGLQTTAAAGLTSLIFIGWAVGAPLIGWLSDRIGLRKLPLLIGLVGETLAMAAIIYIPNLPLPILGLLSFLFGFLGAVQVICFALAKENHPLALSGTAIGIVNTMVTGAGAFFQPLVGLLLDLSWSGATVAGARVYGGGEYRLAFVSLLACALLSFLCLLAVRETYCRPQA
jgi:MFS family permease